MGLFENLGRKVEKLKQEAQDASRERASAECADCGELVYTDREDCPECGNDSLVAREPADEGDERADDAGEPVDETDERADDG